MKRFSGVVLGVALAWAATALAATYVVPSLKISGLGTGLAHLSSAGVMSSSTLVDADVSASAAITATKIGNGDVDNTEMSLLNGHAAALVDTDDAVTTAITGTGALGAGSIGTGFGSIDVGADAISTTGALTGGTGTLSSSSSTANVDALTYVNTGVGSGTAASLVGKIDGTFTTRIKSIAQGTVSNGIDLLFYMYNGTTETLILEALSSAIVRITGDLTASGTLTTNGNAVLGDTTADTVTVAGKVSFVSNWARCTLTGATPSSCTATVTSGAVCTCSPEDEALALQASVSTTTLTVTTAAAVTSTSDVNCVCNK